MLKFPNLESTLGNHPFSATLHGLRGRVSRLISRVDKHEVWCFQIKGNFVPDKAKAALHNAQVAEDTGQIPDVVGLHAAVRQWALARSPDSEVHK
jgi:hypothetical protein